MKIDMLVRLGAAALLASPLAFGGCGGTECGAGTQEQDGTCVAVCAADTTFDETTGQCLPNEQVCGENTAWDAATGSCLPDYDVLCPSGTVWDAATSACAMPAPDVMEAAEPNDPSPGADGTAATFDLPAQNATITLGGTIMAPSDVNDDGELDADFDGFEFEATKGQVIQIEGTSGTDMPSVAFVVVPAALIAEEDTVAISHFGIALAGRNPVRSIRIVEDGSYVILVSEKNNIVGGSLMGGATMTYTLAVTTLPTPADQTLALGAAATMNFEAGVVYDVTGITSTEQLLEFGVSDPTGRVVRTLYLLDGDNNVVMAVADEIDPYFGNFYPIGTFRTFAPGTTLRLFLDYSYNLGSDTGSEVGVADVPVVELGALAVAAPLHSASHSLTSAAQMDTYKFSYTAGVDSTITTIAVNDRTPEFDPAIIIRDDTYAIITYVAPGTKLNQVDLATGTYYIDVLSYEQTFAGPYAYSLDVSVAAITNVVTEGAAANDTCATGEALDVDPLPSLVNGTFTADDLDFYQVTGTGSPLTFTLTGGGDTVLAILNDAGCAATPMTVLDSEDVGLRGDPEIITYTLEAGVNYYIAAYEYYGDAGTYTLLVSE